MQVDTSQKKAILPRVSSLQVDVSRAGLVLLIACTDAQTLVVVEKSAAGLRLSWRAA